MCTSDPLPDFGATAQAPLPPALLPRGAPSEPRAAHALGGMVGRRLSKSARRQATAAVGERGRRHLASEHFVVP